MALVFRCKPSSGTEHTENESTVVSESVCPQGEPGRRRESPEELRARYPQMGHSWSPEDDARLLALYQQGERDFDTLGKQFGRKPSAVRSRLAKLGLESLA
ncbi:SANT/Myb-like DNA-binding domain-containing protein [Streptomyces hirsutus]|nr:SANT/Myb-like DNA-binding domain-containing protein [Streptomyces hirsutus]